MDPLAQAVVARYAREFSSPEALKNYLKDHPDADPKKHTVQKGEGDKAEGEPKEDEKPGGKGILKKLKGKLSEVSDAAKKFLTEAPKAVQSFVADPDYRAAAVEKAKADVKAAPGKYVKSLWKTLKHEGHEVKLAAQGIAAVARGKKMSEEQKGAAKTVAFHLAVAGAAAATGGLSGFGGHLALGLGRHVALKAVANALGDIHTLGELGHVGHHGIHTVLHLLKFGAEDKGEGEKISTEEAFAALVMSKVLEEMGKLSDDDMAEILEGAAKKKEAALVRRVAARY